MTAFWVALVILLYLAAGTVVCGLYFRQFPGSHTLTYENEVVVILGWPVFVPVLLAVLAVYLASKIGRW